MAKQTFTTGQVLTAAQLTNLQQTALGGGSPSVKTTSYVLVAADAGTVIQMNSTSATTVTVNTGLFSSGDSVQIQNIGAGTMTITAGTATVNSAGSLAVSQYDGGFLYFSSASSAIWFDYTQPGTTSPLTTKGDLYTRTSSGDTRLGVGANGTTLVADSAEATGLKWAAASASGLTLISNTSFSAVSSVSLAANQFTSTYTNYKLIVDITTFSATGTFGARLRAGSTDTSTNYQNTRLLGTGSAASSDSPAATSFSLGSVDSNTNYTAELTLFKPNVAIKKWMIAKYFAYNGTWDTAQVGARLDSATQFDSITFLNSSGTITGKVFVYGYAI